MDHLRSRGLLLCLVVATLAWAGCNPAPGGGSDDGGSPDIPDGAAADLAGSDGASDPCMPNPCLAPHRGVCTRAAGVASCGCDPGYHDEGGACVADTTCMPTTCAGHGSCTASAGTVTCACDAGWAPPNCATCATGYHPDGAGGCTTDPCLPNPCTAAHQTVCTAGGASTSCGCDPGYHDDGSGGCTNDPCLPNPCAATNQACRNNGGSAQCYTPNCDDSNPCTTDTIALGACVHTPVKDGTACGGNACVTGQSCQAGVCGGGTSVSCDDADPCTVDSCAPTTGCAHVAAAAGTPCDDHIACTTGDVCTAQGSCTGSITASCSADTCSATQPLASTIDIPVAQLRATVTLGGNPLPATNEYGTSATLYLVAKDTGQWHTLATWSYNSNLYGPTVNPRVVPGIYDVLYCHGCSTKPGGIAGSTDATDAFPQGLRTLQHDVVIGAGVNALAIDIPVAQTSATITLGGKPLPSTNEYGTSATLYAVARDTGQWHTLATWSYNSNLYGPTVTPRLVPGTYDLWYCHNCSTTPGGIAGSTDATDAFPSGLRVLQRGVVLQPGANPLAIDIPVAQTSATITLGGQPLPSTNEYGTSATLYAVAQDTGQWHTLATWSYNSNLYGPTVTPRLVPGTYDVWYCHNCSTKPGGIAGSTDATDAFPQGLRILKSNLVIGTGANPLAIDIPVAQTSATITLGGKPLPSTNEYGTSATVYAVARDTGQWHTFATWSYNSNLYGPTVTPRLVPGTYDLWYCHNCSTTPGGIAGSTDATDAFPSGLRVLQSGVVLQPGANPLAIDIPVAQTSATITLAGKPLPSTNEYGTSATVYAVAKDTGQWHTLATWSYNSNLYGPTVTPRLVPGTYDLWYCHGCSTTPGGIAGITDATDAYANGLRVLAANVSVTSGANALAIDIPLAAVSERVTLAGQSLPSTNEYGTSATLYLVARDTRQWHTLASWSYNSSLYGPTVTPRIVPGTYDVYYCHGCSTAPNGISGTTDATDAFPTGLRALQRCVTIP